MCMHWHAGSNAYVHVLVRAYGCMPRYAQCINHSCKMGHGSSAFQDLSDDQKLSMLQHLKGSYDEKMKEFDGLHKNDRIKALRTKQAELRKKIDALRASFSLVKSNFCMNCISIWGHM